MSNVPKYLKKINKSLEALARNTDLINKTKENLKTINKLEEQIKKNKNIKIETIEIIDQVIAEIENLTSDTKNKSK